MRLLYVLSVTRFLSTLILGASAWIQKYDFKVERKDIAPDGQKHHCWTQVRPLTVLLGFQRSALVINGQTPGPELRFVQGDAVEVSRLEVSYYYKV